MKFTRLLSAVPLVLIAVLMLACSGVKQAAGTGGTGTGSGAITVGGTVTGLAGSGLVLEDNGADNLAVTAAGTFVFKTALSSGGAYAVTVKTQPSTPTQTCAVTSGTGTATAAVTSVSVACVTPAVSAKIGGTVSGLSGTGLVLQNNGGDSLTVTANGPFTFKTPVTGTGAYAVTVGTQPTGPNQICTVASGNGTATADVTSVAVTCVNSFIIGGNVTGVVGTGLTLKDHTTDTLIITKNGAFNFAKQLPTGTAWTVTISAQPTSPSQTCVITPGTGSGTAAADVSSIAVTCQAVTCAVGGNVVGLAGKQPTPPNNAPLTDNSFQLLNNGGDNKIITQNGPFTFATNVALNGAYSISAISFPSTQTQGCTLWNFSGVATANVTNILVDCAHDDWTFINGTNKAGVDGTPNFGSFPCTPPTTTPNPYTNTPGGRDSGAAWTDASGNLWLFGGLGFELDGGTPQDTLSGFQSDLWECQVINNQCQWQLLETPVTSLFPIAQREDIPGFYGTQGTGSTSNLPGGRWGSATWADASGNLWLLGGQGEDSNGNAGLLNDLWKYNIASKQWTWVSGSNLINQKGTYSGGTLAPGARWTPVSWTDHSGNFWLFGGFGYDVNGNLGFLNDLWEYTAGAWVYVSSSVPNSNQINQNGVYGTQGTAAAGNTPGGRQTACGWVDAAGNLWLFGGEGDDSVGTANGVLNDLWEYDITANQWTYVGGSNKANQNGIYSQTPLVGPASTASAAGTVGLTGSTAGLAPGSRWGGTAWTDHAGNLWLFGGWGLDSTGTNGNGYLNDLWVYTPSSSAGALGTWIWVKGSNTGNQNGIYGPAVRPYTTLVDWTPGARRGAMSWVDATGELWLFGGQGYDSTSTNGNGYLNDQWRYLPYP